MSIQGTLSKTQNYFLTIKFRFYTSKMNEICLQCLALFFSNHSEFWTMWGQYFSNFWFIFWEYNDFIFSFWNFLTFSVLAVEKFLSVGKANRSLCTYTRIWHQSAIHRIYMLCRLAKLGEFSIFYYEKNTRFSPWKCG